MTRYVQTCILFIAFATWIVAASIACAQEISGPLSEPLSSGINGNVAPLPSTEIEPGAGNLVPPEQNPIPVDATGASLQTNTMNPSVAQSTALRVQANYINSQVNDVMTQIGMRQSSLQTSGIAAISANTTTTKPVSMSTFKPAPLQSAASSFSIRSGPSATFFPLMQSQNGQTQDLAGNGRNALAGSLRQKKMSTSPGLEPGASLETRSLPASLSSSLGGGVLHSGKSLSTSVKSAGSQTTDIQEKQSPLELQGFLTAVSRESSTILTSPFRDLSDTNFLSTNIFASARPSTSSGGIISRNRKSSILSGGRRPSALNRENASQVGVSRLNRENASQAGISRSEINLLRHEYRGEMQTIKRGNQWHNPILQQMSDQNNK
jgi:hypothetical protein